MHLGSYDQHMAQPVRMVCWLHGDCEDLECGCSCHQEPTQIGRALMREQGVTLARQHHPYPSMTAGQVLEAFEQVPNSAPVRFVPPQYFAAPLKGHAPCWLPPRSQGHGWVEVGHYAHGAAEAGRPRPAVGLVRSWIETALAHPAALVEGAVQQTPVRVLSQDEVRACTLESVLFDQQGVSIRVGPWSQIGS